MVRGASSTLLGMRQAFTLITPLECPQLSCPRPRCVSSASKSRVMAPAKTVSPLAQPSRNATPPSSTKPKATKLSPAVESFRPSGAPTMTRSLTDPWKEERVNQGITLSDGRTLGFAEYGPVNGIPILSFHGSPGCRLSPNPTFQTQLAFEVNVRLICPDRPGYGLSSPVKRGYRVVDYCADINQLVNALGLDQFRIVGTSGGGPYALACTWYFSSRKLRATGLMAPVGHWDATQYGAFAGWELRQFCNKYVPYYLRYQNGSYESGQRRSLERQLREADFSRKNKIKEELAVHEEKWRSASAFADEWNRYMHRDWGFNPEDINDKKIFMYYGTKDENTPPEASRRLMYSLCNADLWHREVEEDHKSIQARYRNEMLLKVKRA